MSIAGVALLRFQSRAVHKFERRVAVECWHGFGATATVVSAGDCVGLGPSPAKRRDVIARVFGQIVAPCSIRSLSEIATGVTSSLLTRAADLTDSDHIKKFYLGILRTSL